MHCKSPADSWSHMATSHTTWPSERHLLVLHPPLCLYLTLLNQHSAFLASGNNGFRYFFLLPFWKYTELRRLWAFTIFLSSAYLWEDYEIRAEVHLWQGLHQNIAKWTEVFHVFVVNFWQKKKPGEFGSLMLYAHPVQKIAESCGDWAALQYDDKFHQIKVSSAFPWQMSNFIRKQLAWLRI